MESLLQALNDSNNLEGGTGSPQFALLNFFFPGFSVLQSAIGTYLGIDLNFYIPLLIAIFGLNFLWGYVSGQAWGLVEEYLMSSFRVRTDHEMYNMLMLWISRQRFSQNSRKFFVDTDLANRNHYTSDDSDDEDSEDMGETSGIMGSDGNVIVAGRSDVLQFTPSFGAHRFWYKGWPITFERSENSSQLGQSASVREELSMSCYGRNPQILKDILQEARQMYLKKDERRTLIFRGQGSSYGDPYWARAMSRPNRPFSTVVMEEKQKQDLIDDIADYINPATRRWYSNRGIPYRRGYLLYGPPGTGKSSISLALAGHFRMAIYIVSLNSTSTTEDGLTSLFLALPTRCLVLLEDIDTAGLTHTREEPVATSRDEAKDDPDAPERLSLSGLLNILDGVASKEGRILMMTTNHIEKLDKALIRPGRVDMLVPFGLANEAMARSMFKAIYAPFEGEVTPFIERLDRAQGSRVEKTFACSWEDERAKIIERIAKLAVDFAAKIPELEFSPAEIQGLLLRHKRSPESAIEAAEDWVKQTRREKKEQEEKEKEAEKRRKEKEKKKREDKEKKEEEEKEKEEKEKLEEMERKAEDEEEERKKKEEEERKKKEEEEAAAEAKKAEGTNRVAASVATVSSVNLGTSTEVMEGVKEEDSGGKSDVQNEEKRSKSASDSDYEKV